MDEKSNDESFVKTVENTANTAIAAGRNVNEVIHDAIEVIYGRKNINELLPSGCIVVTNHCSDCAYNQAPHTVEPCFRCYNRFFDDLYEGPYTDNFKPKEKKEETTMPRHWCADCKYCTLGANQYPCRNCFCTDERPFFTLIDKSAPPLNGKKEKDPKEQKHVEVEDGRYCYNCKYEELKIDELPCHNCYWDAARPSFTPKEEK